jgi:hypothetical protein
VLPGDIVGLATPEHADDGADAGAACVTRVLLVHVAGSPLLMARHGLVCSSRRPDRAVLIVY